METTELNNLTLTRFPHSYRAKPILMGNDVRGGCSARTKRNKMKPFLLAPMSQSTFPNNREGVKRQQSARPCPAVAGAKPQLSIRVTTATVEALGSGAFLSFFLCAHKERTAIKEHTRGVPGWNKTEHF